MAYIGNAPADRFTSIPTVQQFNGDGSTTAFTLSRPVGTDQDLLVSVDGVIQDTAAYAVSNGTTLTFSAAPSTGTANIFVNYLGVTIGSVVHPASSALAATTGTFSSTVIIGDSDSDNAHANADNLVIGTTSGSNGMTIVSPTDGAGSIHWSDGTGSSNANIQGQLVYAHNDNSMRFYTAVTERMRIDSSGNVGIGSSTTDRGLLNVNHDNTGDAFSGSHIALTYDASPTNNDSKAGITYATSDSDNYGYFQGAERTTSGHGAFVLRYHNNSAGGTKVIEVNSNGAVSKFLQPAFSVTPSGAQNNFSANSHITVVFATEVFDVGSNFASNTFTAPVTGKYQLNMKLDLQNIDTAADYYQYRITTSNRIYANTFDPDFGDSDTVYHGVNLSVLADMDASDTAIVTIYQSGGTAQSDLGTGSAFNGILIA